MSNLKNNRYFLYFKSLALWPQYPLLVSDDMAQDVDTLSLAERLVQHPFPFFLNKNWLNPCSITTEFLFVSVKLIW